MMVSKSVRNIWSSLPNIAEEQYISLALIIRINLCKCIYLAAVQYTNLYLQLFEQYLLLLLLLLLLFTASMARTSGMAISLELRTS
jgi:hypothetical protein